MMPLYLRFSCGVCSKETLNDFPIRFASLILQDETSDVLIVAYRQTVTLKSFQKFNESKEVLGKGCGPIKGITSQFRLFGPKQYVKRQIGFFCVIFA